LFKLSRRSPEAHEEKFVKKQGKPEGRQSLLKCLVFIPSTINAIRDNQVFWIVNSCNIDCTLMALQGLWQYSTVGKMFISEQLKSFPDTSQILQIIDMIIDKNCGYPVLNWWLEVLHNTLPNFSKIDMIGNQKLSCLHH